MSFAGLPRGSERADVIAYLNTLSDNPVAVAEGRGSASCRPESPVQACSRRMESGVVQADPDCCRRTRN